MIFEKFFKASAAQANKAADKAVDADPLAVMNLENEQDAAKIHGAEPQMRQIKGQLTGLDRQVHDEDDELKVLQSRVDQALVLADQNKSDPTKAKQFSDAAAEVDQQLQAKQTAHNQTMLAFGKLQAMYEKASHDINDANSRIADRQKHAQSLGQQLQLSNAVKTAVSVVGTVNSQDFNKIGTPSRAEQKLQEMIDSNMAAGDVQTDLYGAKADPMDAINKTLDAAIANNASSDRLAARKAALGIGTPPPTAPPAA